MSGAEADGPVKLGRIAAIDVARGVALAGMVVYHLIWDFAHFGLVAPTLPFEPATRVFSHVVASAFLALVGVSLALAHRNGLNRPAFARRLAIIVAAAALVTVASYLIDPAEPILFGILHCIAVASLIGALLVAAPPWAPLLIGAMAITEPLVFSSDAFNAPALIWLGLGTAPPATLDWRPLLPWAGVVLIGLGLARALLPRLAGWRWTFWRATKPPGRAFAFAGRHSLAIYLVHQPILFGLLWAIVATGAFSRASGAHRICRRLPPPPASRMAATPAFASKACACVATRADAAGVSLSAAREGSAGEITARLRDIVETCSVEAR